MDCPISNCKFCGIKPRSSIRYIEVIPYPIKLKDNSYSDPNKVLPLGSNPKEMDYPGMSMSNKKSKKYKNKVKLNMSTIITL